MPTWAITDDTSSIAIAQNGVVIKNIDKDIVVLRVVPAGVGLNTTAIDQLYIEHDGEYSTQIPYNDVTVSGVTPSSVENFRTRVLTILNNNGGGGGGGNMSTSTYDPAGLASQVTVASIPLTVNQAQAFDIGNDGVDGQTYRITSGATDLPTGIAYIDVKCVVTDTDVKTWDSNGFAYVTTFGKTYPCIYDVATNKIRVKIESVFRMTQTGTSDPTWYDVDNNLNGITWTAARNDPGVYAITPSQPLTATFNEVMVHLSGTQVNTGDLSQAYSLVGGYYDEANDVIRLGSQILDGTPTDGIYNDTPIYLVCILSN